MTVDRLALALPACSTSVGDKYNLPTPICFWRKTRGHHMASTKNITIPSKLRVQSYRRVILSDGWSILTLLVLNTNQRQRRGLNPTTRIFQMSPTLKITLWPPGRRYRAGAIWYADRADLLYGWDFCQPDQIYVCRRDGCHVATLQLCLARKTLLQPRSFYRRGSRLYWLDAAGCRHSTPLPDQVLLARK